MKNKRLLSFFLSAAIFSLCLTGCSDKREIPLDSAAESAVSSDADTSSGAVSSNESGGASSEQSSSQSSSSAPISSSPGGTSSSAVSPSESGGASSGQSSSQSSSSVPTSSSLESTSEAHKHTYTSKTVAPTCVEPGYTVHTCACGDQYTTDTVDALGHDYTQTVVKPTCTASGYTQYTCNRCGYTYKDDYTNALGHKYSSQTIDPTCTKDGYTLNTCERCGSEYRSGHTHHAHHYGHDWGEWTTTKKPTTSSEGEQRRECSRCGEISTQTIPRLEADPADYADEVIRLVNEERAKNGLPALAKRNDLTEYAQLRSTEIVSNFAHERPDGSNPLKYVISLNGVRTAGENIAAGQRTPEKVVSGWMNSPGHRANILNSNYTSIGVGCYRDSNSYYGVYWTQIFAG